MNLLSNFLGNIKKAFSKPIFSAYFMPWGYGKTFAKKDYYYGVVFSCIDAIAINTASTRFHLVKKNDDKKETIDNHPALNLLYRPNFLQTGYDFFYLLSSHIDTFGKSYIYPVFNGKKEPVELWLLDPAKTKPVPGPDMISGYVYYNPKGEKIPFDIGELIEIKRPNPFNQIEGISTIEMAQYEIEGDINAVVWNKNFFEQGAMPSGVLTTDQNLDETTFERLKKQWRERYQGKENAHRPMILEAGLNWQQLTLKQKDMDFIEQRRFSRDEILSIFKVPKTIVAISDDVNRANAETAEYVFAKRVIEPRLRLIFDKLNRFYLPLFSDTQDKYLKFEDPVPENIEMKLKKWETGLRSGFYTINEVRSEDGKEPVENGDVIYIPFNLVPLSGNSQNSQSQDNNTNKLVTKSANHTQARDLVLNALEGEYRAKLDELFRKLTREIRSKKKIIDPKNKQEDPLVDEIIAQIYPDTTEWERMFGTITFDLGVRAMQSAVDQVVIAYGITRITDAAFKKAIDWLKKRVKETTGDVTQTLYNRAREVIARNLADQVVDVEKIREEVADVLDDERDWRVERVVRTELFTAYSEAEYRSYKESGQVEKLKWIAAADERTCPICMKNHLQVVAFGKEFPSGHTHTPAHIQCRCSSIPTTDEIT
jgi:HK97 family phage portal protein